MFNKNFIIMKSKIYNSLWMPKALLRLIPLIVLFFSFSVVQAQYTVEVERDDETLIPSYTIENLDGGVVRITANVIDGYQVTAWLDENNNWEEFAGSVNPLEFTPTQDMLLYVIAEEVSSGQTNHTVNIIMSPAAGGKIEYMGQQYAAVNGSVSFEVSDLSSVYLTAVPNESYSFAGWEGTGINGVRTQDYYSFTAASDYNLTAYFDYVPQQRDVYVETNNANNGTVSITYNDVTSDHASVTEGQSFVLNATPASQEFVIDHWELNGQEVNVTPGSSIMLPYNSEDRTYKAFFVRASGKALVTVNFNPNICNVSVSPQVPGNLYTIPTNVTLSISEELDDQYEFVGWRNDITGNLDGTDPSYQFTADQDYSYTAEYKHIPFTITTGATDDVVTIDIEADGETPAGTYEAGSNANFSFDLTNNSYRFLYWTDNGNNVGSNATYSLTNIQANHNIFARFIHMWSISHNSDVAFTTTATPHNDLYDDGSVLTFNVVNTPDNMQFKCWALNGEEQLSETNPNQFNVTLHGDYEVSAVFEQLYTLTLVKDPNADEIHLSGAGNYINGTQVAVSSSADANSGYVFDGWYDANNEIVSNVESFQYTMDGEATLTAKYTYDVPNVTLHTSVQGDGVIKRGQTTVTGDIEFQWNTLLALKPVAGEGSHFVKWIVDGVDTPGDPADDNKLNFNITHNTNVVAVFSENSLINVTIVKYPFYEVGQVTPCDDNCTFETGSTINFEATVLAEGYEFAGWVINNEIVGRNTTLTLNNVNEDFTLYASFEKIVEDEMVNLLEFDEDSTEVIRVYEQYKTLVTSITIPLTTNGVMTIKEHAFDGCINLESVFVPATVQTIEQYAFNGCTALTSINIPTVTTLGNNVFDGCTSLREVTLSNQLTALPDEAFQNCSALQNINIPTTVTTIGNRTFNGCNLYFVDLPADLTTVGNQAFMGNANLRVVTINGAVQSFGEDAFRGCTAISRTSFNGDFADWFGIEFANAQANPAARSRNLVINDAAIRTVNVPQGVTAIKAFAFFNNNLIDTIKLSESVTRIDSNAFFRNTNLKRIIINGNPNAIQVHEYAFENVNKDNVVVEVPCQYLPMDEWNGFTRIAGIGMPVLTLVQHPGGIVRFADNNGIPECGSDVYTYHVVAIPASTNYRFVSWSDGVVAESRSITISEDKTLSAIFERKSDVFPLENHTFTFKEANAAQDWFSIGDGDNKWVVGNAVYDNRSTDNKSLYVSKDNGATCSYNAGNSVYTYTEVKLHNGLYQFNFNYKVGDIDYDKLSVALIPIEAGEEEDAYQHLDEVDFDNLPLFIGNLENRNEGDSWSDAHRLIDFGNDPENENKWYRLVFYWNVTSESTDEVADFAAAVDNVSFLWMDLYPTILNSLTTIVEANSDDTEMGNAYVWNSEAPYIYTIPGTTVEVPIDEDVVKDNHRFEGLHIYDQIWITAEPIDEHHRFVRWNDGNTEAHRQLDFKAIYGSEPAVYIAYFEPIPENLHIYAHVEAGAEDKGTAAIAFLNEIEVEQNVMRNMIEFVSDTTIEENATYNFVLNLPQEKYAFMGWANANGDTLSKDNPFVLEYGQMSDKLNWGRDIHIFALMNELTPCSYDDNDFFSRNMPFGQFNFRGHDLDDVTVSNVEVSVRNGQIIVSEAAGIEVSLYDVNGRLLESKVENSQNIYFEVPTSGTYMLKVGDLLTRRVVVVR